MALLSQIWLMPLQSAAVSALAQVSCQTAVLWSVMGAENSSVFGQSEPLVSVTQA